LVAGLRHGDKLSTGCAASRVTTAQSATLLTWFPQGGDNPPPAVPALEGNLLNYVSEPNRFGLPAFYELHVWAWEHNPMGSFADWNTHVTCDHQPVSAAGTATR
jgi:hypothetical protein